MRSEREQREVTILMALCLLQEPLSSVNGK